MAAASATNSTPESYDDNKGVVPQVRQHRNVTFSHQKQISVQAKRIMARVLEQIKYGDTQLSHSYKVGVMDLVRGTTLDATNAYKYAKSAVDELADARWNFEDIERKIYIPRHLLNTSLPEDQASRVEGGLITIVLNPALAPYFVQLAGKYTTFNLSGYLELSSWYAMRFFEILSTYKDTGWWKVSLEDYRLVMDCGPELDKLNKPKKNKAGVIKMKYGETKDLILNTIDLSQRELADTPLAFTYERLCEGPRTRGGQKITGFKFNLVHKRLTEIPTEWLEDATTGRLIATLRSFQVTDENIIKYWDILKVTGFRKLIKDWQHKATGNDRINNKLNYCNAALVREGKKVEEVQRQAALQAKGKGQQNLFPNADTIPDWLDWKGD